MKECKRCGKTKALSEFYKALHKEARCRKCVSEMRKQTYLRDREKTLKRVAKYRNEYPEKIRDTKLKQAYGVGINYFNAKLKEQGGVCGGCRRSVKNIWRGQEVNMALDHDHKTNKPRGVLCMKCNRALGLLEENQEFILSLLEYIRKYQK
jgi:murein L,D-transpeptidase YafK